MKKAVLSVLSVFVFVLLPLPVAAEDGTATTSVSVPAPEASCLLSALFREESPVPSPVLFASAGDDALAGCCHLAAEACAVACKQCGALIFQCNRVTDTACVPVCVCKTCGST